MPGSKPLVDAASLDSTSADSRPRRATMRDVAAEASVAVSTVSLYLRNPPGVAPETGGRIAAAIAKVGYTPNRRPARKGRARHSRSALFGLMMEELVMTAFPEAVYGGIVHAVESRAREQGYNMLMTTIQEGVVPPMVREQQVEGVIIVGGCPANESLTRTLLSRDVPLVLIDTYIPGVRVDAIAPDNEGGGYAALRHLIELGHQRIAIIEGPAKYRTLSDRLWGALRAAEEAGVPIRAEYRQPSISSGYPNKGYREMKQLLALPQPPTAVFAVSDRAAAGALEAIKEAGLSVPGDISLAGFDDLYGGHTLPPLTTVCYGTAQMGVMAMDRLLARIRGLAEEPVRIAVYPRLIRRASTAPPSFE